MKIMVLKNLTAHKIRNRMTSIIYSLSLGFIIFLLVSYKLQLDSNRVGLEKLKGGALRLGTSDYFIQLDPKYIEPVIKKHYDKIESFTWTSRRHLDVGLINMYITKAQISDCARLTSTKVDIYGVLPSVFDPML